MSAVLRTERQGAVLRLILCDQSSRNSLSEAMLSALHEALDVDHDARVIVIAADGPAFSSGHNLKELTAHRSDADQGEAYFAQIFALCARVMTKIAQHPCPVIAEVDGLASAAGCQLVATCDLAYASDRATFCTPGVNIGLFCSTPMVALSRNVSSKHAMEMLLTGGVYDAAYAHRIGLINASLPQNQLSVHVMDTAQLIAQKSQGAIKHGKAAFHQQRLMGLEDSYSYCSAIMVQNMLEGSACEGLAAFLEKRKPQWPAL
jgi:enoyl-CoA hydratase/carnithine racemase